MLPSAFSLLGKKKKAAFVAVLMLSRVIENFIKHTERAVICGLTDAIITNYVLKHIEIKYQFVKLVLTIFL